MARRAEFLTTPLRNATTLTLFIHSLTRSGVNSTFSYNHISDSPHNCMLGGGNAVGAAVDCLHEGNVLEDCAYEAADTGAWYSCGQHVNPTLPL